MKTVSFCLAALFSCGAALAQSNANFRIEQPTLNQGGHPVNGLVMSSASQTISFDALGDSVTGTTVTSASFQIDVGLVAAYPYPDEVRHFVFRTKTAMSWDPERSVGTYNVYRGSLSGLAGAGICFASGLTSPASTETGKPSAGAPWFYLVTAENRLRIEGTKGYRTSGVERPNTAPCP